MVLAGKQTFLRNGIRNGDMDGMVSESGTRPQI